MNDKLLSIEEFEFITSNESYAETEDNVRCPNIFKELDAFIRNQRIQMMKGIPLDLLRAKNN